MRRLKIQNPLLDATIKTTLGVDYSSGTGVTTISNNTFAANDLLVFGEPSEELTELQQLNTTSGNTILTLSSALKFSHSKGTAVYKSLWNQISIEGNYGSGFSQIVLTNIQWDNENNETICFDSNGSDTTSYRFRFYNSVSAMYSEYSPTLLGSGFSRNQVGYMIREVRKMVGDLERKIVTDDEIIRHFNRAQDIVYAHNPRYFFLLVDTYKQSTGIACTSGDNVYTLASYDTFGNLDTVRYRYISGSVDEIYNLERKGDLEFDSLTTDLNRAEDNYAAIYRLLPADADSDKGYIEIDPITKDDSIGTLYPRYYEKMADLDSVDDTTQVPIPSVLEDFAISQIEKAKGNETKAQQYLDLFLGPKDQRGGFENITGLKLLDKMDNAQKRAAGQPRSLINFKGRRTLTRIMGNPRLNHDNIKELYFDD